MRHFAAASLIAVTLAASGVMAGNKLVVVDKLETTSKAKVVYVQKGSFVGAKGDATDVEQVSARLYLAYGGSSVAGAFLIPAGSAAGWVVNSERIAKFRNRSAPSGSTQAKTVVIKPGKVVKVVGKGIGDLPFDIVQGGAPIGSVRSAYCVENGAFEACKCRRLVGCAFKSIAAGTGAKLVCRTFVADEACEARCQAGDGICSAWCGASDSDCAGCFADQGLTVEDVCHSRGWEKKTASDGIPNPADLNDVDNRYSWAGECTITPTPCQPTAEAEAACLQQSASSACSQCGGGDGVCDVDPLGDGATTTVWEWLVQLNAAAFGGHSDWRLPRGDPQTIALSIPPPEPPAEEVESLVDPTVGACGSGGPCVDPAFTPTSDAVYWTSLDGIGFAYDGPSFEGAPQFEGHAVRAVRALP